MNKLLFEATPEPGEVLLDSVQSGIDTNLPNVLTILAILIGVGVVVALVRRFIPGA